MSSTDLRLQVQRIHRDAALPTNALLRSWCVAALDGAAQHSTADPVGRALSGAVAITLRIVDAAEMRALNSTYRGRDYATNVLAFPAAALPSGVPTRRRALGDIVVCAPVLATEADDQGKPVRDHWAHLVVHGSLHLLGFDHEQPADATRMEALEKQVLAGCGIADPYA